MNATPETNGHPGTLRVLVGVCSCRGHERHRQAVRETWAASVPEMVKVVCYVGEGESPAEADVWALECPDTYAALPRKTQAFLRRALGHEDWDYVFKCDDDTYVALDRLLKLAGRGDYVGSADLAERGFASGGGGYLLSRAAASIVAQAPTPPDGGEDVWVGEVLRKNGVRLTPTPLLRMDHRDFPTEESGLVTVHWCSPDLMPIMHSAATVPGAVDVVEMFDAIHSGWRGDLRLFRNGYFFGGAGNPHGRWHLSNDGNGLSLRWFHWPAEKLERTETGFRNASFELRRPGLSRTSEAPAASPDKLHLGAGENHLPGWRNLDLDMDIRQRLPVADSTLRFIFAEHVVERVLPSEALSFFREARRVLKEGGILRVSLPCVDFVSERFDPAYSAFLKQAVGGTGTREDAINSIVCNRGHQAIWTVRGLRAILEALGFETAEKQPGESNVAELRGLEGRGRAIGEHANWVETGVVEARKLAATAAGTASLPRKLHFVWLGAEMPALFLALVARWRQLHPGWQVRIWRDEELRALIQSMNTGLLPRFDDGRLAFATRCDIARFHVVAREGGIYLDCDFFPLRSLEPLRRCSLFGVNQGGDFFCSGVFGAVTQHPIFDDVFSALRTADYSLPPHLSAGPHMFHPILSRHLARDPQALVVHKGFFPVHYDDKYSIDQWLCCDLNDAFGAHLWAHSWGENGGDRPHELHARIGGLILNPTYRT